MNGKSKETVDKMPKRTYGAAFGYNSTMFKRKRYSGRRKRYTRGIKKRFTPRRGYTEVVRVPKPQYTAKCGYSGVIDIEDTQAAERAGVFTFYAHYSDSFTAIAKSYDQFRIHSVDMRFWAQNVDNNQQDGLLMLKTDLDDQDVVQWDKLINDPKTCYYRLNDHTTIRYKAYPRALLNVYRSTTDSHGIAPRQTWIDTSYYNTPHYGVKWCVDDETPVGTKIKWQYFMNIEFRGRKVPAS